MFITNSQNAEAKEMIRYAKMRHYEFAYDMSSSEKGRGQFALLDYPRRNAVSNTTTDSFEDNSIIIKALVKKND